MIESILVEQMAQFGLLGVLFGLLVIAVCYMAKRDEARDVRMVAVVENNTVALTRFVESTKKCEVYK